MPWRECYSDAAGKHYERHNAWLKQRHVIRNARAQSLARMILRANGNVSWSHCLSRPVPFSCQGSLAHSRKGVLTFVKKS